MRICQDRAERDLMTSSVVPVFLNRKQKQAASFQDGLRNQDFIRLCSRIVSTNSINGNLVSGNENQNGDFFHDSPGNFERILAALELLSSSYSASLGDDLRRVRPPLVLLNSRARVDT